MKLFNFLFGNKKEEQIPAVRDACHAAVFTNKNHIANRTWGVWYDDFERITYGTGERFDKIYIDMDLSKNYIRDVVIPCCYFAKSIFILNDEEKFVETNIDQILDIINKT